MLGCARREVKAVRCHRDCLRELRWFCDRRDPAEVRGDIAAWLAKYLRLCNWFEDNIEETLTCY
jgi:putative transposase